MAAAVRGLPDGRSHLVRAGVGSYFFLRELFGELAALGGETTTSVSSSMPRLRGFCSSDGGVEDGCDVTPKTIGPRFSGCPSGSGCPCITTIVFASLELALVELDGSNKEIVRLATQRRNHHVSHYLLPGTEYVTYDDYEDLVCKARYYLGHGDERLAIARAGHLRVKSHYDHVTFWKSLLARLGGSAAAFYGQA